MAKNKQEFKVGDLVRVPGNSRSIWCYGHHLPQGSVCEVAGVRRGGDCDLNYPGGGIGQLVHGSVLKLAKQAMRKRDEYAARR